MMATIVLTGLIYHICEMYIDDCIVYGSKTQNGKEVTYYQNRNYIHSNENQNRSSKLWMKHNPVDLT